jgi:holin-like protein
MEVLRSFGILLLAQLTGEVLHRALHMPLPGPVLGMALLALALLLRQRAPDEALVTTSNGLLRWLGLLFVPAGAGVVANLGLLRSAWLPIAVALIVSTLLTITVTALVMQVLLRRGKRVAMDTETSR